MGFLDKLRSTLLGAEFDAEDEFFEVDDSDNEDIDERPSKESKRREREYDLNEYRHKSKASSDSKVLSIHTEPRDRIVITKPKSIKDAPIVTDYLLSNMACVINLENVEHNDAQRIADFLGGTAYALNCEVERVNNDVFVIAPASMNVANELKEDIKNSGSILPWVASAIK